MLDAWESEDGTKIVYVTESTGSSLQTYLENIRHSGTRLHLRVARKWARQILTALRFLNSRDPPIVHGSLFADNLFVNPERGELKVGNLEGAFYAEPGRVLKPIFDLPHGDTTFSSPEALEDDPAAMSKLVDVWTFGVVFLELVTGVAPFAECESRQQQWNKAARGEMPDLLSLILDADIRRFITRCLGPVDTRPSAAELLKDPLMDDKYHLGAARDSAPVLMAEEGADPEEGAGRAEGGAAKGGFVWLGVVFCLFFFFFFVVNTDTIFYEKKKKKYKKIQPPFLQCGKRRHRGGRRRFGLDRAAVAPPERRGRPRDPDAAREQDRADLRR
jgi:hypothetical protein